MKIIAIDFDGTLCENAYPRIGPAKRPVIQRAMDEQKKGAKLILWTCRSDGALEEAVAWCRSYGLEFDAINSNLPESIDVFGADPRKISASEYWDDRAVSPNPISCLGCENRKETQSKKYRVYPWCANTCKNYRHVDKEA